jgi:hypothetical protein
VDYRRGTYLVCEAHLRQYRDSRDRIDRESEALHVCSCGVEALFAFETLFSSKLNKSIFEQNKTLQRTSNVKMVAVVCCFADSEHQNLCALSRFSARLSSPDTPIISPLYRDL